MDKDPKNEPITNRHETLGRVLITALLVGSAIFGAVEGPNAIVFNRPLPVLLHQIFSGK